MTLKRIWIHSLNCSLPRRLGRKISKQLCVDNPKPEEFLEACSELGIKCEYLESKKYPRVWYRQGGMILVETNLSKYQVIKLLAERIINRRKKAYKT